MANRDLFRNLMAVGVGICLLTTTLVLAQSATTDWEKAAGGKMAFDVASLKQNNSGPQTPIHSNVDMSWQGSFTPTGGLFSATNIQLPFYIAFAYKLSGTQIDDVFSQLPTWAKTNRYDIEARAAGDPTKDQYRLMLQSLFADRLKLRVHRETAQVPIYDLVLVKPGKLGPNLRKYSDDPPCASAQVQSAAPVVPGMGELPPNCGVLAPMKSSGPGLLKAGARDSSMLMITDNLLTLNATDRHVIDHTGLLGTFDFTIEWSIPVSNPAASSQTEPAGPTIQEALQDQLGLKLVSSTGPVERLVIDHVEEPTPN